MTTLPAGAMPIRSRALSGVATLRPSLREPAHLPYELVRGTQGAVVEVRLVFGADPDVISVRDRRGQHVELAVAHDADRRDGALGQMAAAVAVVLDRRRRPGASGPTKEQRGEIGRVDRAGADQVLEVPDPAGMPDLVLESRPVLAREAGVLLEFLSRVEHVHVEPGERFVVVARDDRDHVGAVAEDVHPLGDGMARHSALDDGGPWFPSVSPSRPRHTGRCGSSDMRRRIRGPSAAEP